MGFSVYTSYYSDELEVRLEPTKVHPYDVFGPNLEQLRELKVSLEDVAQNFKRFEDPLSSGYSSRGAYEKCCFDLMFLAHRVALLPPNLCRKEQRAVAGLVDIVDNLSGEKTSPNLHVDDLLALHPSFLFAAKAAYARVLEHLEERLGIRSDELIIELGGL